MPKRSAAVFAALALFLSVLTSLAGPAQAATTSGRGLLSKLTVVAESGATTYDRAKFRHWIDANGDCQDARAEVLTVESRVTVRYTTSSRCTVLSGRWVSSYDGATWTLASDVDIDHRVALSEAWASGARSWTATDRQNFANDLTWGGSLEAIADNVNSSKGDRDPAEWMPPLASQHCQYVLQWIQVKYRWRLTVDSTEKAAMLNVLQGACRDRQITIPPRAR